MAKNDKSTLKNSIITRTVISVAISLVLIIFFSILLITNLLSEVPYTILIIASIVTGFIIFFEERVMEFNLKEMRVILTKAKEVEASVIQIAESLIEITAFHSSYTSGSSAHRKSLNKKMERSLKLLNTDPTKINRIMKLPRLMEKSMGEKDPKKFKALQEEIEKEGISWK